MDKLTVDYFTQIHAADAVGMTMDYSLKVPYLDTKNV